MVALAQMASQMPPSERDFEAYQAVVVEGETTREAAEKLGLSQTRVVQITSRVAEWIGANLPATPRLSASQRTRLAADVARQRLDHLYSVTLGAFRDSRGRQTTERAGVAGDMRITRESQGDVRYIAMAARIAERGAKLAQEDGRAAVEEVDESSATDNAPPVGDCSRNSPADAQRQSVMLHVPDATNLDGATYAEVERRRAEFLAAIANENSPVQPPLTDANGMLLEEPMEAGSPAPLPLAAGAESMSGATAESCVTTLGPSRHERRARRRMLEKVLRRRPR